MSRSGLKQLTKRRSYMASGISRSRNAKQSRKGNGALEYGNRWYEEFSKPDIQGKSSRIRQKQKAAWWDQAYDALSAA